MQNIPSLPGAMDLLGQAWAIYKQRVGVFLIIEILPVLLMTGFVFATKFFLITDSLLLIIITAFLLFAIFIVAQTWMQTALIYAIKNREESIGVIESCKKGWHKIIPLWWTSLLSELIIMGGLMLFIVPGIIFAIWFSLTMFFVVAEDLKGMNALLKSREYVKGNWGKVLWRFLFIGGLAILAYLPTKIFDALHMTVVADISGFIVSLFLIPLVLIYSFLIYSNLKTLKGEALFNPTKGKKVALIAIAVLGIFVIHAAIFLLAFSGLGSAKKEARDAQREVEIRQIRAALEIYYGDKYSYPVSLNELYPDYLSNLPTDPSTNYPYQYQLQLDGADYKICAQMESPKTQKCITSQY